VRLALRAEVRQSPALARTFVDIGQLFARLSSDNHQIVFGRRGTGKTHALSNLAEYTKARSRAVVFIDVRNIGSSGGIYNDLNRPLSERGTALLIDVLQEIHNELFDFAFSESTSRKRLLELLDLLADSITQTRVVGDYERESALRRTSASEIADNAALSLTLKGPGIDVGLKHTDKEDQQIEIREKQRGASQLYIHFGAVSRILNQVVRELPFQRLLVIIDEWSHIPLDLQPLLADLLRRSVLPVRGVTVKIGAIEEVSRFQVAHPSESYVGLELGADIFADIDLDYFMSYSRNPQGAKDFFGKMFHAHLTEMLPGNILYGPPRKLKFTHRDDRVYEGKPFEAAVERPKTTERFLTRAFKYNALAELARAAEGIPRDAINIVSQAAQKAGDKAISERQVAVAAREWYMRDKERRVGATNPPALLLFHWLVDEIVGGRHSTAFFLRQDTDAKHPLVRYLYNERLLHVVYGDVAADDQPGLRFVLYRLDYGSYLDVSPGRAAPGTFRADLGKGPEWIEMGALIPRYTSLSESVVELSSAFNT
jgi:hypothetical protein